MYLVDNETKRVTEIKNTSFKNCGLKERKDLQEWIANNPNILGEELLIIQKEFDGFNDTNERLDLLAIDKLGNLVIIENKLDDSGKNVVWQAMKYAGYCSSLTKNEIKEIFVQYLDKIGIEESAENIITEFLDKADYAEVELNQDLTLDLGSYLQSHIEIVIISVTTMVLLIIFVLIKRKKHVRVS